MSGIAGIMIRDGGNPANLLRVQWMLDRMRHRAPDGSSFWHGDLMALGHAWFNTTGDTGCGPHWLGGDQCAIVADCRLDNREDLLGQLNSGVTDICDAGIILACYDRWGEDCLDRLSGDFSFAIWDRRKQACFLARDHFGVKPLYYHLSAARFLFASEIMPILSAAGAGGSANLTHIAGFLAGHAVDNDSTAYAEIRRLPAGHKAWISSDRFELARYWSLGVEACPANRDLTEEFRHLFTDAVRQRMRGHSPIGVMLSGGLDSSSITAVAGDICGERGNPDLSSFSMIYEEASGMDERAFIDAVLQQNQQIESYFIPNSDHGSFPSFDELLSQQEEPFLAPGLARTSAVYRNAGDNAVRVLLDGHGGDEVVSHGFGRLHELAANGCWLALWRELRGLRYLFGDSALSSFRSFFAAYGPLWRVERIGVNSGRLRRFLMQGAGTGDAHSWQNYINPDFARQTDLGERVRHRKQVPQDVRTSEQLLHRWNITNGFSEHAFEVLDKVAARSGVEARYPFWDKRLVEFCVSLPSDLKLKNGWSRLLLRRAMEGVLPRSVQWRRDKTDFKRHLIAGMLGHDRDLIDNVLGSDGDRIAPYVHLQGVKAAYQRILNDPDDAMMEDAQAVWRSVCLSTWLRQIEIQEIAA